MVPTYLPENKKWSQITRDERYFCSELYHEFKNNPKELVKLINAKSKLDGRLMGSDWELGYEVCFYRDLIRYNNLHSGGKSIGNLKFFSSIDAKKRSFPFKRTFDLCLFGETQIVVIEAKVHQGYDTIQLKEFERDKEFLLKADLYTKQLPKEVLLIGLHSSHYKPKTTTKSYFTESKFLTWLEISELLVRENRVNPLDYNVFLRANEIKIEERKAKESQRE